jgi:hypothetical protein
MERLCHRTAAPETDADRTPASDAGLAVAVARFDAPPSALSCYRSTVDGTTLLTHEGEEFVAVAVTPEGTVADALDAAEVDRDDLEPVTSTAPAESDHPELDARRGD